MSLGGATEPGGNASIRQISLKKDAGERAEKRDPGPDPESGLDAVRGSRPILHPHRHSPDSAAEAGVRAHPPASRPGTAFRTRFRRRPNQDLVRAPAPAGALPPQPPAPPPRPPPPPPPPRPPTGARPGPPPPAGALPPHPRRRPRPPHRARQ